MSLLMPWVRGARLLVHLAVALVLALAVSLDPTRRLRPEPLMRWWCELLLEVLNVRLVARGAGIGGPRVLVANHVSWLDIPVIASREPTRFVAKSEIRYWPVVGWLARAAGTFFIRRGKGGARPLLAQALPHLQRGGCFVFFPEGTTTDGRAVRPFHPRLFGAAVDAGVAVQPIALRYGADAQGRDVAPFVGDDDLLSHIVRLLCSEGVTVEMAYGPALREGTRDELAQRAHAQIAAAIAAPCHETVIEHSYGHHASPEYSRR